MPGPHRCATTGTPLPQAARVLVVGAAALPVDVPDDGRIVRCAVPEEPNGLPRALARIASRASFDVVVVGQDATAATAAAPLLGVLRSIIRPSGQLLARFPNAAHGSRRVPAGSGMARGGMARGAVTRPQLRALLAEHGFRADLCGRCYAPAAVDEDAARRLGLSQAQLEALRADRETYVEHHAVAATPVWTDGERAATDLALSAGGPADPSPSSQTLLIASVGVLSRDLRVGYRLSLPPEVPLRFVDAVDEAVLRRALGDQPADAPVLRTTPLVVPDPRWVGRLWSAWSAGLGAVGCRLLDHAGVVVHASADPAGRTFGAGTPWAAHPTVTADRPAVLRPPLLAAAVDLGSGEPVPGRHLGDAAASQRRPRRRPEPAEPGTASPAPKPATAGEPAPLAAAFGKAVLFLDDAPPSRRSASEQGELHTLWSRLAAAGRTPVLHWDVPDLLHAREAAGALERAGVLVFGGDASVELPAGMPRSSLQPDPAALAAALAVEAVVYLSARRFQQDATEVGLAAPAARMVLAAGAGLPAPDGADLVVPRATPELAEQLEALCAAPVQVAPARVEAVPPHAPVPGLTTIVIPVWNLWTLTERCLDAIQAHTTQPHEVIVVDNGSTDATAGGLAARGLRVITNPANLGFATACNQGIAAASGEFVCVLNNDTEPTAGWLDALLAAVRADEGVGLVGPRSNSVSGPQVVAGAPALTDAGAAHAWARRWMASARGSWPTRRLVGFCLLARRRLFEQVGAFDTGYGVGNFEDDDLCDRVLAAGFSLRVCDQAVVLHHGSATFHAAGIDWSATMRTGARRFAASRTAPAGGLLTAVVLSDGEAEPALAALRACAAVADGGLVIERGGLAATELAVTAGLKSPWRVLGADWHSRRGLAQLLAAVPTDYALVLRAHERLRCADWGAVRAELDSAPRRARGVHVAGRDEVRVVAPGDTVSIASLGQVTADLLPDVAIAAPALRRLAS